MTFVYGESFRSGVSSLQVLTGSFLLLSIKHIFVYFNVSRGKIRVNVEAELLGLLVGITLNFFLIGKFGGARRKFRLARRERRFLLLRADPHRDPGGRQSERAFRDWESGPYKSVARSRRGLGR